jgi:site-specific recombinase XerC
MTRRIRDCRRCGRAVGKPDRDLCARCHWAAAHAPVKHRCPRCGIDRVLQADAGRCVRCSRTCRLCAAPVLFVDRDLCKDCARRHRRDANRVECPRCRKRRILRSDTGWCGPCSRPGRPPNPDAACVDCGRVSRPYGAGRCRGCWARSPHRIPVRAANLAATLDDPPDWLGDFAAYLVGRHHPSRACAMLTRLGKHLVDDHPAHAQALLDAVAADVPLARALEDFLTANKLALPPDRDERRAAARRRSRIDAVPEPLRDAVAGFAEHLVRSRDRARRAGTHPRGHATLEARLTTMRDFAQFLTTRRSKTDWATVEVGDIEAFLHAHPGRRASYLAGLRQFCRHARRRRLILIDPTAGVEAPQAMAFRGPTLPADRQRELFRRWSTGPDVHPHEAFVGLAALLHGVTTQELQRLTDDDIDHESRRVGLGRRPQPTPLDPWTWAALQRCLDHRKTLGSNNSHVLITTQTKATRAAASDSYVKNTLRAVGIQPRILRSTRLVDLVGTVDPKLVADIYGMTNEAVIAYLADHVDTARLPNP